MLKSIALATLAVAVSGRPQLVGQSGYCPFKGTTSEADLTRAQQTKHTGKLGGKNAQQVSRKINGHLSGQGLTLQQCSDFSADALDTLVRKMWCHFSPDLTDIYGSGESARLLRYSSLEEYEVQWAKERVLAVTSADVEALVHAKCAEVLMMWAHHVPDQSKKSLASMRISLPTMPVYDGAKAELPAVKETYTASFSCVSGHNNTGGTSDHKLPHWPAEAHYHGMGHGAYPFWLGGGGAGGTGAPIEVWWSEPKASEKFYHSSCSMTEAGYSKDTACYHLFVGKQPSPMAYLYTATEDFCCLSGPVASTTFTEKLTSPGSDWMDGMTKMDNMEITTSFYTGEAKHYLMTLPTTEPVTYFWYLTDLDDKPLQQGEGGFNGKGIEVYHDYNTSSFEAVTLSTDVFAIPEICKTTTKTCTFP